MHGSVKSAGAPKCDVYIRLTLCIVERQQEAEQVADLLHGFVIFGVCRNIFCNACIHPGHWAQIAVPMGVTQKPEVKDKICVVRHPAGKTKTRDRDGRMWSRWACEALADDLLQIIC